MLCGSLDPLGGDFGGELDTCICVAGASQVVLVVKNLPPNAEQVRDVGSVPGLGRPLEESMATHSNVLAWRIPRTEEPGGLQSKGSNRVRND